MLTPRLLPRCYIPIKLVDFLPRERQKLEKEVRRAKYSESRRQSALFRSLQNPLFANELLIFGSLPGLQDAQDADRSFTEVAEDESEQTQICAHGVGPEVDVAVGAEVEALDMPVTYDWSELEIMEMARGVLSSSLKMLCAKGNPSEKIDVLDWVFESEIADIRTVAGPYGPVQETIYTRQCAFSFPMCCAVLNYDPSVFRSFLIRRLPQEAKRYFIYRYEADPLLEDVRDSHKPRLFGC